jgi:hypothetical protein
MRGLSLGLIIVITALALFAGQGCGILWPEPVPPQPTATPTATPWSTPTPLPTATPTPAPPAVSGVDSSAAEALVREYFGALNDGDYERMLVLTAGEAHEYTSAVIEEVRRGEEENRVSLQPSVETLDVTEVQEDDTGATVSTRFVIHLHANLGFFTVLARTSAGEGIFRVELVDGEPRIVGIAGDLREL